MSEQIPFTPATEQQPFSVNNETNLQQGLASLDSYGYGIAGIMAMEQPGVVAKVAGAALIAKGVLDHYDLITDYASKEGGLRERSKSMFFSFAEKLAQDPGEGLSARIKRSVGESALSHKDKELKYRFNRMMGGLVLGLSGAEMIMSGSNTGERVLGAIVSAVGVSENMKGTVDYMDRDRALQDNNSAAKIDSSSVE